MAEALAKDGGDQGWDSLIREAAGTSAESKEVSKQLGESAQLKSRIAEKLFSDTPPPVPQIAPPVPPPQPPQQKTPLESFGGVATLIGILGGFLTRNPIQASLQAATGAMNGYRQRDLDTFKQNYEQWKVQSEYAQQVSEWQQDQYSAVLKQYDGKHDQLMAAMQVIAARDKDLVMQHALRTGDLRVAMSLYDKREQMNLNFAKFREGVREFGESRSAELSALNELKNMDEYKHANPQERIGMEAAIHRQFISDSGDAAGWQIVTEEMPDGTKKQIRYNARTTKATTMDGQPTTVSGSIEKGTGQMGAREAVFTDRVIQAANQASKDLSNIVKLPVSASSGLFGGRTQGPSLLDATKEVMANKMTTQETQLYNVRIAGLQRTLAAIEAAGLMPSGMLTHMMDAVVFKEGDTQLTKLDKLAQARQIVESAIEVIDANPRISQSEKKKANDTLDQLAQSVPFTHDDVTGLYTAQQTNPKTTMRDLMRRRDAAPSPQQGGAEPQTRYKIGQVILTPRGPAKITGGDLNADPEVELLRQ